MGLCSISSSNVAAAHAQGATNWSGIGIISTPTLISYSFSSSIHIAVGDTLSFGVFITKGSPLLIELELIYRVLILNQQC